uniref:Xylulose kinase-1 n=1 Tax=Tanacetum cinerariifolium TaxID=118510 RepID=A0A6L2KIZ5_TANCI|nr:xylulose kinase-1 [Tanacetum cinerariifolium]
MVFNSPYYYYEELASLEQTVTVPASRYIVPTGSIIVTTGRNSLKITGRGTDGSLIFLPPATVEEHLAVQRESKARTTLLQSIPDDHIADFHYMDDARDIWNAVKARFGENVKSKKMRKSILNLENQRWTKTSSYDDLYYKLKTLEMDIKGYSTFSLSQSAGPSHIAFVSATSTNKNLSYGDCPNLSSTTTYSVPSNSKTGTNRTCNVIEDVLQLFVADTEPEQQLAYEDLKQIDEKLEGKLTLIRQNLLGSTSRRSDATSVNKEAIFLGNSWQREVMTSRDTPLSRIRRLEERKKIQKPWVLTIEFENTSNLLKYSEKLNADCETTKKDLQTKLDNHLLQTKKWRTSSKNLYKLIDSSMSVRTKVGLGFTDYISQNELRWDDSAFSVFTTTFEDVEGRPTFHRFAKLNSMKTVPPPLTGDYTSLSDHTDLDESQMVYGIKSSTSNDFESVTNDFVSCDDSDKSSEDNTSDFASCDSSGKSSEHKPTNIESNVRTKGFVITQSHKRGNEEMKLEITKKK